MVGFRPPSHVRWIIWSRGTTSTRGNPPSWPSVTAIAPEVKLNDASRVDDVLTNNMNSRIAAVGVDSSLPLPSGSLFPLPASEPLL